MMEGSNLATATAGQPEIEKRDPLDPAACGFYCRAMEALERAGVPFLVGGAYAFARYTGIVRHTKDFDLFLRPEDFERAIAAFEAEGWKTERPFPHWLGKAYEGDYFVDLIFSSGNGIARVDDVWFRHAVEGEVLGKLVKLCPAEEMIWSKSFILERERCDTADVAHVLLRSARELDWDRLLWRFGPHWRVLLAHLVLFGYVYPGERTAVPEEVMAPLLTRLRQEGATRPGGAEDQVCRGPILSRLQYLVDVEEWGYRDARLEPKGAMSAEEVEIWTKAARDEEAKQSS